jgi:NCS1 family nucleobase:cation symporter-1
VAKALGGVDFAFFVGIPVAAILYWLFCRNLDVNAEAKIIDVADRDLDAIAAPIA